MNIRSIFSIRRSSNTSLDDESIVKLFDKYSKALYKYSYINQSFDADLYSECKISMLRCIRNYKFDEKRFRIQFYEHMKKIP